MVRCSASQPDAKRARGRLRPHGRSRQLASTWRGAGEVERPDGHVDRSAGVGLASKDQHPPSRSVPHRAVGVARSGLAFGRVDVERADRLGGEVEDVHQRVRGTGDPGLGLRDSAVQQDLPRLALPVRAELIGGATRSANAAVGVGAQQIRFAAIGDVDVAVARPLAHSPTRQEPAWQTPVALGGAQSLLHAPQLASALRISVSQPLAARPSQSAKPSLQAAIAQEPALSRARSSRPSSNTCWLSVHKHNHCCPLIIKKLSCHFIGEARKKFIEQHGPFPV